jgi:hypothetical protein
VQEYANREWQLEFKRMLGPEEIREWDELQSVLAGVSLIQTKDEIL